MVRTLDTTAVQLSIALRPFAAHDPGGWGAVIDRALLCEEAGVDRLVVPDHVVFGERLEEYGRPEVGGQRGGKQPTGPDGHWLEPLTVLTWIGSRTRTVRLATNILIAALRRPVVLAKTAATLDVLSGGRLDLGVGVGWQREEYEAAGLDFTTRGRQLDHTLEVVQVLWRERRASHHSARLDFDAIHQMPKPVRRGGVPIWVSGTINPRTVQRLARFGTGWIPWGDEAVHTAAAIPKMRDALVAAGRDEVERIGVVGYLPIVKEGGVVDIDRTMDGVPALVDAGVTDFRAAVSIPGDREVALERMRAITSAFRTTIGRALTTP
jgi:probable F420-dependent oxidoreductase